MVGSAGVVAFEHHGVVFEIPRHLLDIQRRWYAAHAECERLERKTDAASVAAYRASWEERMAATLAKLDDPWLTTSGTLSLEKDLALRACAA